MHQGYPSPVFYRQEGLRGGDWGGQGWGPGMWSKQGDPLGSQASPPREDGTRSDLSSLGGSLVCLHWVGRVGRIGGKTSKGY